MSDISLSPRRSSFNITDLLLASMALTSRQVLPILPNLIPYLVQLDPTQPIIIGSSLKTDRHLHPHFSKQMYGFSWGVVRSIAAAKLSDEEKQADIQEGELIGRLMVSRCFLVH